MALNLHQGPPEAAQQKLEECVMNPQHYRTGDRVKTCETIRDLPVGSYGVIKRIYHSLPGTYDVQFEHRPELYTVWGGHLELTSRDEEPATPS